MSEKLRKKKDGQEKSKERQAVNRGRLDKDAQTDKPSVHRDQQLPDSFEHDLKKSS